MPFIFQYKWSQLNVTSHRNSMSDMSSLSSLPANAVLELSWRFRLFRCSRTDWLVLWSIIERSYKQTDLLWRFMWQLKIHVIEFHNPNKKWNKQQCVCVCVCVLWCVCYGVCVYSRCGDINLITQSHCGDLPPMWGQNESPRNVNHWFLVWRLGLRFKVR